jgi:hypothetical protein
MKSDRSEQMEIEEMIIYFQKEIERIVRSFCKDDSLTQFFFGSSETRNVERWYVPPVAGRPNGLENHPLISHR